jgi:GLPGLI family protein
MKFLFFFIPFELIFGLSNYYNAKSQESFSLEVTYNTIFKYRKDSNKLINTNTKLYISDTSSLFIEERLENILRVDASDYENMDKNQIQKAQERVSNIKYFVEKMPNVGYLTHNQELLKTQFFGYKEKMMSSEVWQIRADTTTIAGLRSIKAECTYGGREWIAWFAPEISISEGPYKFSGLPGLIVKLESTDSDYLFVLAGLKKSDNLTLKLPERRIVDKKKFKDIMLTYYDNLFPENTAVKGTINGKEYNREETIQFLKKGELNKNYIELD